MNNLTADLLARIQNGIERGKETVLVPKTKMNTAILEVLKKSEMIEGFDEVEGGVNAHLIYDDEPLLSKLTMISKPGQRIYVSSKEITPVMNGRGISIISTSKGLMTGAMAKSQNLGGELICEIW